MPQLDPYAQLIGNCVMRVGRDRGVERSRGRDRGCGKVEAVCGWKQLRAHLHKAGDAVGAEEASMRVDEVEFQGVHASRHKTHLACMLIK